MLGTIAIVLMVLWLVAPLLAFTANFGTQRRLNPFFLYGLTVMAGFLLLIAAALLADMQLNADRNRFDLDGDGGIGGAELTPEAQRAMDDWASDTGRTMVIFTGIPLSAIWFGICFSFLYICKWVFAQAFCKRSTAIGHDES